MPTGQVLHSCTISQVMLNYAAVHGVEQDTVLLDTGIEAHIFQDPDGLITPDQEMRLIANLIDALPDVPALGFDVGMQYTASVFGIWGYSLTMHRNLKETTERSLQYVSLSTAYCQVSTDVQRDEFAIIADPTQIPEHLRQFLLERDIGTAINLMREVKLQHNPIKRLEFTGAAPPYAARIAELAEVEPVYGCRRNALVFSLEDALRPLPQYNEQMVRLFEDQCRQLLQSRAIGGMAGQVRNCLLGQPGLAATLEHVAAHLNLSGRNLRRKLDNEGTSFRVLQEELREQLACQLLETTEMTMDELALRLGYTDTASFTRAFRRWRGKSPGRYRSRHRP